MLQDGSHLEARRNFIVKTLARLDCLIRLDIFYSKSHWMTRLVCLNNQTMAGKQIFFLKSFTTFCLTMKSSPIVLLKMKIFITVWNVNEREISLGSSQQVCWLLIALPDLAVQIFLFKRQLVSGDVNSVHRWHYVSLNKEGATFEKALLIKQSDSAIENNMNWQNDGREFCDRR